ncbi:MAG: 4-hydroxythreonine-4-phosphate dehydrogenase PdxA [Bacteroidetes bacterium]|nr:MAG: 4-hydroxythreonine-4-phosphate dehydrogenase PdxA [Bacteroidota bacterium]
MSENKIRVGITQGDSNGIGLEVIIKTFLDPQMMEICMPVLFSSQKTFSFHRKAMNVEMRFNPIRSAESAAPRQFNILNVYEEEIPIEFGSATELAGKYSLKSIEAACEALEQKKIDVLVTAPINKHNIQSPEFQFKGHTDYLEMRFKSPALMLMCADQLRVGVVTGHVPLANVSAIINEEKIIQKIKMVHRSLADDFGIGKPKIAVLGLNPHAGDAGVIGSEEKSVILPAITKVKSEGMFVMGPYSADGFFGSSLYLKFDAVLAMYHDQGLIPFKALAFETGVNYSAGLPIIRTSPDHGVGYDIAGKNKASENSFRSAVYLACDIFKTRKGEKEITANPLKALSKNEREFG